MLKEKSPKEETYLQRYFRDLSYKILAQHAIRKQIIGMPTAYFMHMKELFASR
ncbi:hypothetical protein P2W68_01760 [Chryseobacterium arthrosphaerae]|uniref:hypothetical protein n=1 Tax=Chryseobacterium arthrosphaerae TaxID=651561 RepID=UPI0023E1278E|nr:hypothetical protein [Chryseobacterium arthrosphaerae]WES98351.1 hypothetical protein P2W68_01760 [Chryseobacterium arthrosphaerae]